MRKPTSNQVFGAVHVLLSTAAGVALCYWALSGSLPSLIAALAFAVAEDTLIIRLLLRERSELRGDIESLQARLQGAP